MAGIKAYYNEIEPYCCSWLSNLMDAGAITPGRIDDRSITDVRPDELTGYNRCHFFAGLGGWDYALQLADWGEREVWTGSCPCQPFSVAGKGAGTADPRHLWPDLFRLISACRPAVCLGEQVAGAAGYGWFDGVASDLESQSYTCRAVDIPACAINAPHQRNRLYWLGRLADTDTASESRLPWRKSTPFSGPGAAGGGDLGSFGLADADAAGLEIGRGFPSDTRAERAAFERSGSVPERMGYAASERCGETWRSGGGPEERPAGPSGGLGDPAATRRETRSRYGLGDAEFGQGRLTPHPGSANYWADWELIGPDPAKKWRRIEPGLAPLVARLSGHVGQLRAYGNAICAPLAAEVVKAFLESE